MKSGWNRRRFLNSSIWLGSMAMLPAACGRQTEQPTATSEDDDVIGVQLFAIREQLAADPHAALQLVADIGYREVELFGFGGGVFIDDPLFGLEVNEFREVLDKLGISAPLAHVSNGLEDVASLAETARVLGVDTLVDPFGREFLSIRDGRPEFTGVTGLEQIERLVARLNAHGKQCAEHGLGFAYHNHHLEFGILGDRPAFDFIVENTDPELVRFELDIGWVAASGHDPVEYLDRYQDRFVAVHLKDFDPALPTGRDAAKYPIPEQAQLVAPGEGNIDFPRVIEALDKHQIRHRFVEIDVAIDPQQSIERGFAYLSGVQQQGIGRDGVDDDQ